MDKTNRKTQNTLTNTASAQQQARLQHTGARAASASTPIVQEAPSLASSPVGNTRGVQDGRDKKLDIAFNILKQLFEKMLSDESAMDKILQMLSKREPKTQETLVEQFFNNKHVDGETFVHHFLKGIPIFLYISLNKNFQYPNPRSTILNVLTFKLFKKCIFTGFYSSNDSANIEKVEDIIKKILFSPVYLKGSKTSIGVFQLAQVVNQESIGEIQDYIFDYFNALDRGAWSETSPGQCSLYFAYGFLGKNLDVLGRLFSCLEKCTKPEFKAQTEQKISELFGYFLDDLSESYIKDYRITPNAYDEVIHYICQNCPQLVDSHFYTISNHCAREESANLLMDLLALKNSKGQCFLDLIYDKQDARLMGLVEANLVGSSQAIISSAPFVQNLELPNLRDNLILASQEPTAIFEREELFRYLLLSIMLKDVNLIRLFSNVKMNTPEDSQRLVVSLIKLAEYLFELYPPALKDYLTAQGIKKGPLPDRELFFKILKLLNPFKVLEKVDLITNLLSRCLDKDLESDLLRDSTPIFAYVLENLQKIGFDLHYIDPETGHNILSEAYELEMDLGNLKLFNKLLCLGCNPFLVRKEGVSVYVQLNSNRRYGKLAIPVVLEAVGLNKHPFLPLSFTKNILKNNRLDQKDVQGRTPLMVYVMSNIDLKDLFGNSLQKLERKHLEAQDYKGWTVFDYAENNKDQVSLKLLNARKEALEKQANKPSLFRQAAALITSGPKSSGPKIPSGDLAKGKPTHPPKKNINPILTKRKSSPQAEATRLKHSQKRVNETNYQNEYEQKAEEEANPALQALNPEITINYDSITGTSTTSMKKVREDAAAAIAKEEKKKKRKEDREKTPAEPKKKEGFLAKAKKKLKVVATTLETAKNFTQNPQAFVKTLASKLSQTKAGERLRSGQRVYNIGKAKAFAMLEDGLWLGNFSTMTDLANEAIGKGLTTPPSNGVIKTLEAMDHAIAIGKSTKINRLTILEAAQWVLGGSIETGHGSHMNLHYTGGVLTIPESKDGSENANIVYIKKAAGLMSQHLRSLLLGYELSQSTVSSSDSSEEDKWTLEPINNDGETSSEENAEEGRNETPEPSESSE